MIPWLSPGQTKTRRSLLRRQRAILQVEALEGRDCPSASGPQITSFSATVESGHMVLLSGTVVDSSPTTAVVTFGGVGSGSVTPNASGYFQVQENIAQLGTVFATLTDPGSNTSSTAQATVNDPGVSLTMSVAPGPSRTATVTGQVCCNSPAGLTVTLSGVVSGSVTTTANGTFTFTGPASALGQVQATVTDVWGVAATSSATLTASPPTIVNFQAINLGNNVWTFTGQVQDEYAAGLVVKLAGITSLDNNNATATVQADGTFSYTIALQPGESGSVTANCMDWWGQPSNQATALVIN
jgi:hypothetical protein